MKRMATAVALLMMVAAPAAMAQGPNFGWTISNSTTDPLSNSGAIAPGPSMFAGNLYLWLYCSTNTTGMAAMEADVQELAGQGGAPTGFSPLNGFLNAGNATALLLAVGGCRMGPSLAGSFSVGPDSFVPEVELCLIPSALNNRSITVQCGGQGIDNATIGFTKTMAPACNFLNTTTCVASGTAVEGASWGQIKGLYK
ncbi:MAG TPA: hypothetical protein VKU85_12830 [bacterium]|nr:hypothetical protein [bacterium]